MPEVTGGSRHGHVARAALASFAFHAGLVLLLLAVLASPEIASINNEVHSASLTYVRASAKGGGGGGGGAPRAAVTPPSAMPAAQPETVAVPPPPMPVTLISTPHPLDLPGTMTGLSAPVSLAPGGPGGGGTQSGPGAGDGKGRGLGPGSEEGTGGGEYQPGDNVTVPQVIFEKRPTYTSSALLARIQGVVELEAVVMANGTVARPRVVRSLDPGLDQRAIEAVTQWRFKAGRRRDTNEAVNVVVRIHLTFLLR